MTSEAALPDSDALFEYAACGLVVTDAYGKILRVNHTFCAWLGFAAADLVGQRRLQDLFTIGGKVFHQTHLAPLLQMQGSVAEVQLDMRHRAGHTLPMLFNCLRRTHEGQVYDETAVFIATDRRKYESELLAARKHAEEALLARRDAVRALQESRDVLGIAMRGAKMGVWSRQVGSTAVWWSSELEALAGLKEGSFPGTQQAFHALIHEADLEGLKQAIGAAEALARDCTVEFRMRHASGTWIPMEGQVRLASEQDSARLMLYGIAIDITDRVEAEWSAMRQAAIFADQSDAIIVTDGQGKVREFNPAAERMLGYRSAEAIGADMGQFYRPEDATQVRQAVQRAVTGEWEWRGDLVFVRRDGSEGCSEAVIKPLRDRKGNSYGAVSVHRDMTERQRDAAQLRALNAQLADADRRKDEFLATLAHELRNPLAPLRNVLEIFKLQASSNAQMQWAQQVFERQMNQVTHLVDDLMEVSRITQGRLELRREPVALTAVMQDAVQAVQERLAAAGHRLEMHLPIEPVTLEADPTRLVQILTNLLNNAIKYTPDGGLIVFSGERRGAEAAITVRDSGIGIAPENLDKVFTMFAQLEPGLDRAQGGLGIGLSLVRGLVALHGGRIRASSEGTGRGSQFALYLPLPAAPLQVAEVPAAAPQAIDALRRVLVVDDNADGADTLQMALEMLGYRVQCAYNGTSALALAQQFLPHAVVLDIGLPDMDGYQVARRLRTEPWGREVILIAATGWGQDADRKAAVAAGFDHHLVKPVDFMALDKLLRG
ncbi:hybrid sensor histidine kinase/response regulator [Massilia sp. TSP1-1-2]|uniref:hybrid sensor histidine kinase/response regulator n=1 Tax=Massilia sp. TSP1-1-2 TaxID=2804649 RepID=UPI003CECB884